MFDKREDRLAILADLRRRLGAEGVKNYYDVTLRQDDVLAAPGPLAGVLPGGGLRRGSVLSLGSEAPGRAGGTSLLLALLAAPRDIWCAVVGVPDLGLVAASEMGVDLSRLGLVPDPGPDIVQIISVLADGVDLIATASPLRRGDGLPPARQRVIAGRLRESGAVLLVAGQWPGADIALTVTEVRWTGIGRGHGRLRDRELDVTVAGRRLGAPARVTLALRADGDAVRVVEPEVRHTGSSAAQASPAAQAAI